MTLFKKKVSYTDYVGHLVTALINTANKDISLADTDNLLTDKEREKVSHNLLPFSLAILLLELGEIAQKGKNPTIPRNTDPSEINSLVSQHFTELIGQIYAQNGFTKQEYQDLVDSMMPYLEALDSASPDDYTKGADFIITSYFSTHILGKQDYSNEQSRMRHFAVFDMARQVCKNTQNAHRNYAKDFAITA